MYRNSLTVFREYVQNSCDAIDSAMKAGILQAGEGGINITLDPDKRNITISDNGIGIKSQDFRRVMGNVADSDKRQNESRGFRGIGRLCGMAYCETVIFTAKFKGENVISRLECNGGVLRQLLHERDSGINRYTASEVLAIINDFSEEMTDDTDAHYFIVELEKINDVNTDLLDFGEVKKYLSFTAPVPYSTKFDPFAAEIYAHAEGLRFRIDEYNIFLNAEQLFKEYEKSLSLGRGKGRDKIHSLKFEDFRDISNRLAAWMWFGISDFRGSISDSYPMRGIRLRKGNIQVGNENTLRSFFAEPRGVNYFIGEIFCVSDGLVPNSQRDYFSESPECADFEKMMKNYFRELSRIYHAGSEISSSFRKIDEADKRKSEFERMSESEGFTSHEERQKAEHELMKAAAAASQAREKIDSLRKKGSDITRNIIGRIEDNSRDTDVSTSNTPPHLIGNTTYRQKLLAKVFEIIRDTADERTADRLITRISDWFRLR